MIKIDDFAKDVDYRELGLLESHLMHEKNRLGEAGVVEKYKDKIEELAKNDYEYNFLCGFLKYFGNRCNIELDLKPKKLDKVVINAYYYGFYELDELTEEELEDADKDCIKEFKEVGILKKELGEAC